MADDQVQDVAILGAGPAGLVTALTCLRYNVNYRLYERGEDLAFLLGENRSGYDLSKGAVRVFSLLGLGDVFERYQIRTKHLHFLDPLTMKVKAEIDYEHAGFRGATRNQLQSMFLEVLKKISGGTDRLVLGYKATSIEEHDDYSEVTFENGEKVKARVVVGGDGMHGASRPHVVGNDPAKLQLRPTKHIAWLISSFDMEMTKQFDAKIGAKLHHLHTMMRPGCIFSGGRMCMNRGEPMPEEPNWMYYIVFLDLPEAVTEPPEDVFSMNNEEACAMLKNVMKEKNMSPLVWENLDMLSGATFNWLPLFIADRAPIDDWTRGRTLLIGDAAHLMTPYHGQGASMACIDGYVLGTLLGRAGDLADKAVVDEVFSKFSALRVKKCNKVVNDSHKTGDQMSSVFGQFVMTSMFWLLPKSWLHKVFQNLDQTAGDLDAVPPPPPLADDAAGGDDGDNDNKDERKKSSSSSGRRRRSNSSGRGE